MSFAQCLTRASLARPSVALKAAAPARRGATVVRRAKATKDIPDDWDLDSLGGLMSDSEDASRAPWLPGSYAPLYLDGSLPGDFGFDPLGLGKSPVMLAQFREAEVIHCRWAMLGVAGMLGQELLGYGNWIDAPLSLAGGADATYAGTDLGPAITVPVIIAAEVALMGFVESKRGSAKEAESRVYPGGAFDPMGLAKGDLDKLKLNEIKNGRLAMVAVFGFFMQGSVTHTGPVANLCVTHTGPVRTSLC